MTLGSNLVHQTSYQQYNCFGPKKTFCKIFETLILPKEGKERAILFILGQGLVTFESHPLTVLGIKSSALLKNDLFPLNYAYL